MNALKATVYLLSCAVLIGTGVVTASTLLSGAPDSRGPDSRVKLAEARLNEEKTKLKGINRTQQEQNEFLRWRNALLERQVKDLARQLHSSGGYEDLRSGPSSNDQ